ncbi:GvpL/GvpF family gas vesicle protein [Endozoicomonas sp. SM1973]|uniref:GvpL/GvpF family gas vesicle protein n=1 Tax=Spartinivicinus marinus TaxID=2994442 RepID=A0A853I221_9GAMM|nr:GvpL/GvpF family gas vesicle protein [Spartinivicinus marinus]MCX4028905.1 GvpL/GvpF family gas vesicle protein [Spartinivicinus marinus]NYZ65512.1 GvpL/GvpF family gas vesicle protein [Spartinivicinus marinus]
MKCLLYCLFQTPQVTDLCTGLPVGVQGKKVLVASYHDLFAAYSFYSDDLHQQAHFANSENSQKKAAIRDVLVFSQIIERLYNQYTLIPIRFGCCLDNKQQLISYLSNYYQQYTKLLTSLDNLAEFSIKALLPSQLTNKIKSALLDQGVLQEEVLSGVNKQVAGAAYLQSRRSYYNETTNNAELNTFIESINDAFQGLYHQCQWEVKTQTGQQVLSIYYLVAKKVIKPFDIAFQQLLSKSSDCQKLLLSGPWPPYNFVTQPMS